MTGIGSCFTLKRISTAEDTVFSVDPPEILFTLQFIIRGYQAYRYAVRTRFVLVEQKRRRSKMSVKKCFLKGAIFLYALVSLPIGYGICAEKIQQYIPDAESAAEGMTLWQTIMSGGSVMIVLAFLSIAALALIVYYFMTMDPEKLLPGDFQERVLGHIENGEKKQLANMCRGEDNLISAVLSAGMGQTHKEKIIMKEAMEDEGRRLADLLWQKLSYLADVAAISPMVGLLGTVLGMIQAFNVIAFQTGAVKPILLASGISKAMVTTATGLMIAIPSMIFYSFFKGKVRDIVARLEGITAELYQLMAEKI